MNPNHAQPLNNLGGLGRAADHKKALDYFSGRAKPTRRSPKRSSNLGLAYFRLNDNAKGDQSVRAGAQARAGQRRAVLAAGPDVLAQASATAPSRRSRRASELTDAQRPTRRSSHLGRSTPPEAHRDAYRGLAMATSAWAQRRSGGRR